MQYITPTVQFLLGMFFFHEPMPAMRWVGFALIWVSLVLVHGRVAAPPHRQLRVEPRRRQVTA